MDIQSQKSFLILKTFSQCFIGKCFNIIIYSTMFICNLLFKLCSGKWGLIASSSHVKSVFGSINLKLKITDTHTEEHHCVAPWCSSVMYDCSLYTDYHVFKEVVTCEREVEMDRVLSSASSAGVLRTLCSQQWPKPETRVQRRTEISPEREGSANALFESSNRPSSSLKHELSRCEEDSCVFISLEVRWTGSQSWEDICWCYLN